MKKIIALLFFTILTLCAVPAMAQYDYQKEKIGKDYVDTSTSMIWANANLNFQLPFGNGYLASVFSYNYNIGTNITYKTSSNWTFEGAFNYMFGSNIKCDHRLLFGDILNSNDEIIDANGMQATIYLEGRYWFLGAGLGKIIPVTRWKNSGLWIKGSFGYFSHQIQITDPDNMIPQLEKNSYRKGYDRRSGGFAMNQFVGYLFMHKKRVASFYAGIEITEMWTKPNRTYVFTEGPTDKMNFKFSGLLGFKIGWNIPFYEKKKVVTLYTY